MSLKKRVPVLLSADQRTNLMAAAERAADAAAEVTLAYFRHTMQVHNKAGDDNFDPVTQADRLAELAIRECLVNEFPDIGFYGEEHEARQGSSGLTWVVDPIDGTRAFMSGMPLWGTLIGLFDGQSAVLGLMDQPFLNERYTAVNGRAQMRSSTGIQVLGSRTGVSVSDATLYCTTPDMFPTDKSMRRFNSVRRSVRLTRYGGDCYAYGLLAAGYIDIVLDGDLQPYDIQALIPMIEMAGGVVSCWDGTPAVDGGFVVACASRALHDELLPLLQG